MRIREGGGAVGRNSGRIVHKKRLVGSNIGDAIIVILICAFIALWNSIRET